MYGIKQDLQSAAVCYSLFSNDITSVWPMDSQWIVASANTYIVYTTFISFQNTKKQQVYRLNKYFRDRLTVWHSESSCLATRSSATRRFFSSTATCSFCSAAWDKTKVMVQIWWKSFHSFKSYHEDKIFQTDRDRQLEMNVDYRLYAWDVQKLDVSINYIQKCNLQNDNA